MGTGYWESAALSCLMQLHSDSDRRTGHYVNGEVKEINSTRYIITCILKCTYLKVSRQIWLAKSIGAASAGKDPIMRHQQC